LKYLGWKQEEIIKVYGEPDIRDSIGGPGGEFLLYSEKNISFIFAGDEKVVNNIDLLPGGKILGVEVGMTFDKIEEILGPPFERGYSEYTKCYTMTYFLGEEQSYDMGGTGGEIELFLMLRLMTPRQNI